MVSNDYYDFCTRVYIESNDRNKDPCYKIIKNTFSDTLFTTH